MSFDPLAQLRTLLAIKAQRENSQRADQQSRRADQQMQIQQQQAQAARRDKLQQVAEKFEDPKVVRAVGELQGDDPREITIFEGLAKKLAEQSKQEQQGKDRPALAQGLAAQIGNAQAQGVNPLQATLTGLRSVPEGPEGERIACRGAAVLAENQRKQREKLLEAGLVEGRQRRAAERTSRLIEDRQRRAEGRKEDRLSERVRQRRARILLKIAEGKKISASERRFLDELAKQDPIRAIVGQALREAQASQPNNDLDQLESGLEKDFGGQ